MMPRPQLHNKTIAILGYHKIGEPPPDGWQTWNYIPANVFENQMEYLNKNGWEVFSFQQFMAALSNPELFSEKTILLTFDDGYRSNLKIAIPILKKYNYPAVMFVPTSFVGGYNAFDADIFYEPKEEICTWEELQELERNNISVQSHGVFHSHLSELSAEQQMVEITESKELLEQTLKKNISIFSFPYGDNGGDDDKMRTMLYNTGYKAAVLYSGGFTDISTADHFTLARVPVGADTNLQSLLE